MTCFAVIRDPPTHFANELDEPNWRPPSWRLREVAIDDERDELGVAMLSLEEGPFSSTGRDGEGEWRGCCAARVRKPLNVKAGG